MKVAVGFSFVPPLGNEMRYPNARKVNGIYAFIKDSDVPNPTPEEVVLLEAHAKRFAVKASREPKVEVVKKEGENGR